MSIRYAHNPYGSKPMIYVEDVAAPTLAGSAPVFAPVRNVEVDVRFLYPQRGVACYGPREGYAAAPIGHPTEYSTHMMPAAPMAHHVEYPVRMMMPAAPAPMGQQMEYSTRMMMPAAPPQYQSPAPVQPPPKTTEQIVAENGYTLDSLCKRVSLDCFRCPFTFDTPHEGSPERAEVFVGQVPFSFTAAQVAWLVKKYGGATHVYSARIVYGRSKRTGQPEPKGCARVTIDAAQQEDVMKALYGNFLFTETELLEGQQKSLQIVWDCLRAQTSKNLQKLVVCELPDGQGWN